MAAPKFLKFKPIYTAAGQQDAVGTINISDVEKMTMPEFLNFQGTLMNVRRRKRYDMAIYEANKLVDTTMIKEVFRAGLGSQDSLATSPATEFKKTRFHTNMPRSGDFGTGSVTILHAIEAHVSMFALKGTTVVNGAITNPLGAAVANSDAAMTEYAITTQWALDFYRSEDVIVGGLLRHFPQLSGISGVAGAAVGAVFQNSGGYGRSVLDNPQVFVDNEDFHVTLSPLANLDITTATGLTINGFTILAELNTIELRERYE